MRSPGDGAESECGTGRVLQDRLNQLHEGLASKEKHRKVISMPTAQAASTIVTQGTLMMIDADAKYDIKFAYDTTPVWYSCLSDERSCKQVTS